MSFIEIPYRNCQSIIVNTDEIKSIVMSFYCGDNKKAIITYELRDEIITQTFNYEYDPYTEHENEWEKDVPCNGCSTKNECTDSDFYEKCPQVKEFNKKFEDKYKKEAVSFNRNMAAKVMEDLKKKLEVKNMEGPLQGEIEVKTISKWVI